MQPEFQNFDDEKYQEMVRTEQFLCPANRNHKLGTLDKLEYHIHRCKEIKHPTQTRFVYYCQFFPGHLYMIKQERDEHELVCKFGSTLGKKYDPNLNKFSQFNPHGKVQNPQITEQIYSDEQKRNYEYAKRNGLLKQKKFNDEIPINSYEFNKDLRKVDELISLQLQKVISENNENQCVFVVEGNQEQTTPYVLNVIPLNETFLVFIQKRLPYNYFLRERSYYDESLKNRILDTLSKKPKSKLRYHFTSALPIDLLNQLITEDMINDYQLYLELQLEEYRIVTMMTDMQTLLYYNLNQNEILLFVSIGQQFRNIFKNSNFLKMVSLYSQFAAFTLPITEKVKQILEPFINFQTKENETQIEEEQQQEVKPVEQRIEFEKSIDFDQQKLIGQKLAIYDQLQRSNRELQQQVLLNQKANEEYLQIRRKLQKEEFEFEKANKVLQLQIDANNTKNRKLQIELESKNLEEINKFYKKKEQEHLQQTNQLQDEFTIYQQEVAKITDQITERRQYKKQLQSEIERLNKIYQQLDRSKKEIQTKNNSELKQCTKSKYYYGEQLIFEIPQSIKCSACNLYKSNVIFLPCRHSNICRICFDKFEPELSHICYQCEQPIKKVIHLRWENQLKK